MCIVFLKRLFLPLLLTMAILGCKGFFKSAEADAINRNLDPLFESEGNAMIATEFLNDTSVLDHGSKAIGVSLDSIIEPTIWVSEIRNGATIILRLDQGIYFKENNDANFTVIGTWNYDQNLREFSFLNTQKVLFKEDAFGAWSGQLVLENGQLLNSASLNP